MSNLPHKLHIQWAQTESLVSLSDIPIANKFSYIGYEGFVHVGPSALQERLSWDRAIAASRNETF